MKALARYQVILLGEQRHIRCEQFAQGCCPNNVAAGVEPVTSRSRVRRPTTTPPSHHSCKWSHFTPVYCTLLCLLLDSSYLDYIKTGGFFYSFWVTLMIVLITGTARISLFCMGYILACFIFLWLGEDMILKPVRKLLSMWMGLLIYNYLVIMAKCALQVCVINDVIHNTLYMPRVGSGAL